MKIINNHAIEYNGKKYKKGSTIEVSEDWAYKNILSIDHEYMLQKGMDVTKINEFIIEYFERR